MSTEESGLLKKTVNDLKQVLNSSLGEKKEHIEAIDQIETIIDSIESKLNNLDFAVVEDIGAEMNAPVQLTRV